MDMKSYDLKRFADFLLVPYRPVSGNLAKDLKNSFVFTFDSLQVLFDAFLCIVTAAKNISPFMSSKLNGHVHGHG